MTGYPCPVCCNPASTASTQCVCGYIATTDCNREASVYSFSSTGLTNDNCTHCSLWNGAWDLCYSTINFRWESSGDPTSGCGHTANAPMWTLERGTTSYTLTAQGLGYVWNLATTTWKCQQENTLKKSAAIIFPNPCSGVSTSITLVPCVYWCECCTSPPTNPLPVTLSGIGDAACSCTDLSATFLLPQIFNVYTTTMCYWYNNYGATYCSTTVGYLTKSYTLSAFLQKYPSGINWSVELSISGENYAYTKSYSSLTTSLDCGQPSTLLLYAMSTANRCSGTTNLTCRIN